MNARSLLWCVVDGIAASARKPAPPVRMVLVHQKFHQHHKQKGAPWHS